MSRKLIDHFFGGFVRLHILYHAAKQPVYGVELMEELARHGYKLGPGTLYPILHRMEEDGYLKCQPTVVDGHRRKNYRATAKGRRLLRQARERLKELASELIHDVNRMVARDG